jgi:hypothetical protein
MDAAVLVVLAALVETGQQSVDADHFLLVDEEAAY